VSPPAQAHLATALDWAAALDADDFARARACLSPECVYQSPVGVLSGPEAILTSYSMSSRWAHETFDSIRWESACELEPSGTVLITFIDITDHRGEHHVYRCRQRVGFDSESRINQIEHLPIEGEERRLAEFFDRVGVTRNRD
jgi:hypothetical protein